MGTSDRDTEQLGHTIGVALAMIPRSVRRAYAEKITASSEPAQREIAAAVTAAVMQIHDVKDKPAPIRPATGRSFLPSDT